MRRYAIRRIIQTVPVVAIVSVVVFAVIRLVPGDPAISMAGADATPETIAAIRESLGLDRPVWAQYLAWLGDVLRGQFGSSLLSNQPVLALILPSAQATLYLTAFAMAVALALGILFGMLAGVFHGRLGDRIISGFSMLSVSMPPYWVGLLLVLAFSVKLGWFPSAGNQAWGSLVLPATALILGQSAMLTRLVRSSIINILAQDYIRTAKHKGLSQARILLRHALPNSLGIILTFAGVQLGHLLAGAVVVEVVFSWPGMGRLAVNALIAKDLPVVQACILLFTVTVLAVNLTADLLHAAIDPRVAYE